MRSASLTSRRKCACSSTPGIPKVLPCTRAMICWSHGWKNSWRDVRRDILGLGHSAQGVLLHPQDPKVLAALRSTHVPSAAL